MTKIEFIHLLRRLFPTPFCLVIFCVASSPKKCACLSYEMAQFVLKLAHLAISIEPTLLLEKVLVAVSFPDYGP